LSDNNRGAMLLVVVLDRRFIGVTAVDGHRLGNPVAADGFLQKGPNIAKIRYWPVKQFFYPCA
jgi:hypothetical protein